MLASKDAQNEQEDFEDHDDFTTVLPAKSSKIAQNGVSVGAEGALNPIDVDAFWLQRQISNLYPDALTAQQKTEAALVILQRYLFHFCLIFFLLVPLLLEMRKMI